MMLRVTLATYRSEKISPFEKLGSVGVPPPRVVCCWRLWQKAWRVTCVNREEPLGVYAFARSATKLAAVSTLRVVEYGSSG